MCIRDRFFFSRDECKVFCIQDFISLNCVKPAVIYVIAKKGSYNEIGSTTLNACNHGQKNEQQNTQNGLFKVRLLYPV